MLRLLPILISAVALILSAPAARAQSDPYHVEVQRCLSNWKDHPFGNSTSYRLIEPKVGVFGIGGDIRDDTPTAQPELVYVRPSVSVMSKSVLELLNPNGWYCLEKSVSVMAKTEIQLHCHAHLTFPQEGVSVMGGGDAGVNVMGATRVEKVGCDAARPSDTWD